MAVKALLKPVVGKFVICSEDADYKRDDDGAILWRQDGEPVTGEKYPIYFESGEPERAQYWTEKLDKAFVFGSLADAVQALILQKKPEDCQIMALAEQPESATV